MMRAYFTGRMLLILPALLATSVCEGVAAPAPSSHTPAEKATKALRKEGNLEINAQTVAGAVNQLREQTGLNFVLDPAVPSNPLTGQLCGNGLQPQQPVTGEFHQTPLGDAVRRLLRGHHLTYAVAGDTVWITTPEQAIERQLEQTVSVDAEDQPLAELLRGLARRSGANLVLDRRLKQNGQEKITIHLADVSLATAVELLADEANLRLVRLDTVLYVTSEERAEKLRKSRQANRSGQEWQWSMDEKGAIRMTGTGTMPWLWQPNLALLGGGINVMGGVGALGFGGGNIGAGAAGPVPLPAAPAAKPDVKKPEEKKPEVKPAPATKPKEKPNAEALLPRRFQLDSSRRRG